MIIVYPLKQLTSNTNNISAQNNNAQHNRNWIILLDGLHEIPSQFRPAMLQFISLGLLQLPDCIKLLVTSRPSCMDITDWLVQYKQTLFGACELVD